MKFERRKRQKTAATAKEKDERKKDVASFLICKLVGGPKAANRAGNRFQYSASDTTEAEPHGWAFKDLHQGHSSGIFYYPWNVLFKRPSATFADWFACARTEVPAWSKILFLVISDDSSATSTSRIREFAADILSTEF